MTTLYSAANVISGTENCAGNCASSVRDALLQA